MKKLFLVLLCFTTFTVVIGAVFSSYNSYFIDEKNISDYSSSSIWVSGLDDWIVVKRNLSSNLYYNSYKDLYWFSSSLEPMNYFKNDIWTPINTSFYPLSEDHIAYQYNYRFGNEHGLYSVFAKNSSGKNLPIGFVYDSNESFIRSQLIHAGYQEKNSFNWTGIYDVRDKNITVDNNTLWFYDIFPTGIDLNYSYHNAQLKENIILSNNTKNQLLSHPPSSFGYNDNSCFFVFVTKLDFGDLRIFNGSVEIDRNYTLHEGRILFKNNSGSIKASLPIGYVFERFSPWNYSILKYDVVYKKGQWNLVIGIRYRDLVNMSFPVVFDPTTNLQVGASTDDCDEDENTNLDLTGIYDYSGDKGGTEYNSSHRFTSVDVPQSSTIVTADFSLYGVFKGGSIFIEKYVRIRMSCLDEDDIDTFSADNKPSNHSRTDAHTDVSETVGGLLGRDAWEKFNLTTSVQEIIDRESWVADNDLAVTCDDNGSSTNEAYFQANSYDKDTSKAAKLDITYTVPPEEAPPSANDPYPLDNAVDVELIPFMNITVTDPNGDTIDVVWHHNVTVYTYQSLILRPEANGSSTELETLVGANSHFEAVDEESADDLTSYVADGGYNDYDNDTYVFQNITGLESGTINHIDFHYRVATKGTDPFPWSELRANITLFIGGVFYRLAGNTSSTLPITDNDFDWVFDSLWHRQSVNPSTGNPWSWSDLNDMEVGIYLGGNRYAANGILCTQLYLDINYTGPSWAVFGTNYSVVSGTQLHQYNYNFTDYDTEYFWYVSLEDSEGYDNTSSVFSFTTLSESWNQYVHIRGRTHIKGGRFVGIT